MASAPLDIPLAKIGLRNRRSMGLPDVFSTSSGAESSYSMIVLVVSVDFAFFGEGDASTPRLVSFLSDEGAPTRTSHTAKKSRQLSRSLTRPARKRRS